MINRVFGKIPPSSSLFRSDASCYIIKKSTIYLEALRERKIHAWSLALTLNIAAVTDEELTRGKRFRDLERVSMHVRSKDIFSRANSM